MVPWSERIKLITAHTVKHLYMYFVGCKFHRFRDIYFNHEIYFIENQRFTMLCIDSPKITKKLSQTTSYWPVRETYSLRNISALRYSTHKNTMVRLNVFSRMWWLDRTVVVFSNMLLILGDIVESADQPWGVAYIYQSRVNSSNKCTYQLIHTGSREEKREK